MPRYRDDKDEYHEIWSAREIEEGEELFVFYGIAYDREYEVYNIYLLFLFLFCFLFKIYIMITFSVIFISSHHVFTNTCVQANVDTMFQVSILPPMNIFYIYIFSVSFLSFTYIYIFIGRFR